MDNIFHGSWKYLMQQEKRPELWNRSLKTILTTSAELQRAEHDYAIAVSIIFVS